MAEHTRGAIVILGAGVAGLSTAYHLLKKQSAGAAPPQRVVLLESEARPGGLAVSLSRDGIVTDLGPHRLHTELPEIQALLLEIAKERLIEVSRESHIYWRGQRLKYPVSPVELLLRLGPMPMSRLGGGAALARVQAIAGLHGKAPDSFARVMTERFGGPLWHDMLGPYTQKVWKCDPAAIHGDVARVRVSPGGLGSLARRVFLPWKEPKGQETALKSFKYPKGGLQTLVDILVEKVTALGGEIFCNKPIQALEVSRASDSSPARISMVRAGAEGSLITLPEPEAVVSTIPLPTIGRLLDGQVQKLTADLDYLAMLLVVLIIGRDRLSRDNWLYFFDANVALNRAYEAKNFDPDMAPPGRTVLCCEVTCRPGDDLWCGDHHQLRRQVASEVAATGLFSPEEVVGGFVHPLRWAYPVYELDYRQRLGRIFGELSKMENLLSVGRQGLFNHNNTDHSMSMGMAAAETILQHRGRAAGPWFDGVLERFGHFRIVD
jgi:protoporphyrinogen oxidase